MRAERIASAKFLSARNSVRETVFSHLKLATEETENAALYLYVPKKNFNFLFFVDVEFLFASF